MKTPPAPLIAEAFLKTQMTTEYGVTTTLPALRVEDSKGAPKDNWGGKQVWVTPRGIGIGTVSGKIRTAMVTVRVWAKPFDKRRFWGKAETIAEDLIALGEDWTTNMLLGIPYPGYVNVSVSSFSPIGYGRRIENDPQGLARVEFDAQLTYTILRPSQGNPSNPVPPSAGNGGTTRFDQTSSLQWTINHNLNYYPLVQCFDEDGQEIEGLITQLNTSTVVISWNSPRAGFALVS